MLDGNGKLLRRGRAGQRWINQVALGADDLLWAVCTMPAGGPATCPRCFASAPTTSPPKRSPGGGGESGLSGNVPRSQRTEMARHLRERAASPGMIFATTVGECCDRLRRSGWSFGGCSVPAPGGGERILVDGTNGENARCAEGPTLAETLRLACKQARSVGMLAPAAEREWGRR